MVSAPRAFLLPFDVGRNLEGAQVAVAVEETCAATLRQGLHQVGVLERASFPSRREEIDDVKAAGQNTADIRVGVKGGTIVRAGHRLLADHQIPPLVLYPLGGGK